jgi:hypothetical protein
MPISDYLREAQELPSLGVTKAMLRAAIAT